MNTLKECKSFSCGCFIGRDGNVKARISGSFVVEIHTGKIIGYIRNNKLYDTTFNYLGVFKNGTLYRFGGSIWGHYIPCNKKETLNKEKKESKEDENQIDTLIGLTIIGALIALIFKIVFF